MPNSISAQDSLHVRLTVKVYYFCAFLNGSSLASSRNAAERLLQSRFFPPSSSARSMFFFASAIVGRLTGCPRSAPTERMFRASSVRIHDSARSRSPLSPPSRRNPPSLENPPSAIFLPYAMYDGVGKKSSACQSWEYDCSPMNWRKASDSIPTASPSANVSPSISITPIMSALPMSFRVVPTIRQDFVSAYPCTPQFRDQ